MKQIATRAKKAATISASRSALGKVGEVYAQDPPTMDEPKLQDLLKDEILLKLMSSDKVEPLQLQVLLDDTRARLLG